MNGIAIVRIVIRARFRINAVHVTNGLALAYGKGLVDRVFGDTIYVQLQNRNNDIIVVQSVYILIFAGIVVILA